MASVWTRTLGTLPAPVQDVLRFAYAATRVTSDPRSLRTFVRLTRAPVGAGPSSAARVRLRPLGGREVLVRPGTSDLATLWGTFVYRNHLPPPALGTPLTIWDLGANIGLTMAHFAHCFPQARVLGVELDEDNVALARLNVAAWGDRCEVVHAAVWPVDQVVHYQGWPGGTSNYHVTPTADGVPVRAMSLATLIRERGGPVDYLKIDVEGAESSLFRDGTGWADEVRCLKVELHGGYDVNACEAELQRLGYETCADSDYWPSVIAVRRS